MQHEDFRAILNKLGRTETGHLPRINCKSGLNMSVQASEFNYSSPRKNLLDNLEYYEFEIGFPNKVIDCLEEYAEYWDEPTETVYSYVPFHVIQNIIEDNGGMIVNERKQIEFLA